MVSTVPKWGQPSLRRICLRGGPQIGRQSPRLPSRPPLGKGYDRNAESDEAQVSDGSDAGSAPPIYATASVAAIWAAYLYLCLMMAPPSSSSPSGRLTRQLRVSRLPCQRR
ncbi:hypothetical protein FA95DRAFT_260777 [Auriscalpium vulgare]|uniref:Uncharacterized protein n=1 Tax=Auriscalpium vulgare TaxID=40419 RepID=A0ACB8RJP5_9AGAM|nr:hypothetical protein FA95DRAFT_260777 [Auriscalpium vulgare]